MAVGKPDISLFFPVYRDEKTVRRVTEKALRVLNEEAGRYEVIIVDDGCPDGSGAIADELAGEHDKVRVIHHGENRGYGEAIKTGLAASQYEWIFFTDGDDEYDVYDLKRLVQLRDFYDLIITFRYVKLYSGWRIFTSWVYNTVVRFLFRTPYRDISTGLRLVRKSLANQVHLDSPSPFIGAELTIKTMLRGYRVGEVGIQTFPREFGKGASVTPRNILATLRDIWRTYHVVFSDTYQLPGHRNREKN